jgi:hypothetical protein
MFLDNPNQRDASSFRSAMFAETRAYITLLKELRSFLS